MTCLHEAKTPAEKAQRVLLGHLLMYPSTANEVFASLRQDKSEAFAVPLRAIFEAIASLYDRGVTISEASVISEMERQGTTLPSIQQVFIECIDAATHEYEARSLGNDLCDYAEAILHGHYFRLERGWMAEARSHSDVVKVSEQVIALDAGGRCDLQRAVGEVIDELIDVQTAIAEGRRRPGWSWGVPGLDEVILIRPGKFYTVAAQKGAGKTKFLLSVIDHNLSTPEGPTPCLLFSLEMSDIEVIKYLASRRADVDSSLILTNALNKVLFEDIRLTTEELRKAPLEIDSSPTLTVRQIVSRIRNWKIRNRVADDTGIVGLDFLQLVTLERDKGRLTEAAALKNVAYELAEAAKQMRVSIIALAQLNKQADGKKPEIGFIEGSGGLAQASQGVLLLDLLRLRSDARRGNAEPGDELNVIVAKNRDGESNLTIECLADLSVGKFADKNPKPLELVL